MADKDKKKKSGGYTSIKDMFDGGGAGRSGSTFQGGGVISAIGNAAGVNPAGSRSRAGSGGSNAAAAARRQSAAAAPRRTVERAYGTRGGLLDAINGGGLGARGASFQGLPISTALNMMGVRPQGSEVANPQQEVGLRDFVDGGGFGEAGDRFEGGGMSFLANSLGIVPMGYEARQADTAPAAAMAARAAAAPTAAPLTYQAPAPVSVTPLDPVGAMPIQDLLAMIEGGIGNAEASNDFYNSRTNTQMYDDPLGREVNPLYANYPFMRF